MKKVASWVKKYRWWLAGFGIFIAIVVLGPWVFTIASGTSVTYDSARVSARDVPKRDVAIVFGAKENNGSPSPYLQFRIDAAVALYKAGTVKKLLMSGDNSTPGYDEPTVMGDTAVKMGVKREDVVLDYAGFSTFDTCYRAKYIFGVTSTFLA